MADYSKSTPGPWVQVGLRIIVRGRGTIATIPTPSTDGVFDCSENARLIAKAPLLPKMAAALRELLGPAITTYEEAEHMPGCCKGDACHCYTEKLRVAIEKSQNCLAEFEEE